MLTSETKKSYPFRSEARVLIQILEYVLIKTSCGELLELLPPRMGQLWKDVSIFQGGDFLSLEAAGISTGSSIFMLPVKTENQGRKM